MDCWIIKHHVNMWRSLGITYCSKKLGFQSFINKSKETLGFYYIVPFCLQITQLSNMFSFLLLLEIVYQMSKPSVNQNRLLSKYINKSRGTWMNTIIVLRITYAAFKMTVKPALLTFKSSIHSYRGLAHNNPAFTFSGLLPIASHSYGDISYENNV